MKCQIPQISWHSRDPVLSVDFQPGLGDKFRLASGGTDTHVLIWYITYDENKTVKCECASDLYRHNKSVNVVRFSPNGEFLASGDDEGAMFIWQLKDREPLEVPKDDDSLNKEEWYPVKLLRGHLEDVYDISWSKDGNFLVSASMDNTAIIWDMQKLAKVHIFSDFKGYVQGVSWDPCNKFVATLGSDRTLRVHHISSKKSVCRVSKAPWSLSTEKGTIKPRLFHDDTLKSYFRRLSYTPDGELLIAPSGIIEKGDKLNNACYVFSRHVPNKPLITLPTGDWYTIAVRCNPFLFKLRKDENLGIESNDKENSKRMINLPYRMIFAVAACDSVLMYDTEQLLPFACISNIHYTHLTDLAWSPDGLTLIASSTDGYCSFIIFTQEELGEIYVPDNSKDLEVEKVLDNPIEATGSPKEKTPTASKNGILKTAKSPQYVVSVNGSETVENAKNSGVAEKKCDKKSPKIASIKKFLVSPKIVTPVSTLDNPSTDETSSKNNSANKSECEVVTLSDTPVKSEVSTLNDEHCAQKSTGKKCWDDGKAMEVEENESIPNRTGVDKQTKCKARLDFSGESEPAVVEESALPTKSLKMSIKRFFASTSKVKNPDTELKETSKTEKHISTAIGSSELKPIINDLNLDVDTDIKKALSNEEKGVAVTEPKTNTCASGKPRPVVVFDENASDGDSSLSVYASNEQNVIADNDWKLELSQDDEAMVTTSVNTETKISEVKTTPKRRIPFVTLSTKSTLKK